MSDQSLKDDFHILLKKSQKKPAISIREILEILSGKSCLLALILLSLPFCQPIQIPGLSTLFGLVIAAIGLRMIFGKNIWLPKKILSKRIASKTIQKIVRKSIKLMNKMSRFIHPRLNWICKQQIANGILIVYLGLFLALPLPIPFTNLIAGWAIFLASLGLLENDGGFVLVGYFASVGSIIASIFALKFIL